MDTSKRSSPNRLIESERFPFEFLSLLGKKESWRKEIYRPVYHMHKWWAKRLGSVFRGILLSSMLDENVDFEQEYYKLHEFNDIVIFDPFMGSGTTIGEAQKLGMTALGRDINPVACEAVRVALSPLNKQKLASAFAEVSRITEKRIRTLYQTIDSYGQPAETLYYFWVMQAVCPKCSNSVDLFSNYVFARHAYPKKKPKTQVICPSCSNIFQSLYTNSDEECPHCFYTFNVKQGNTQGSKAVCNCGEKFSVSGAIRDSGHSPQHRLYAKLILRHDGKKEYLSADDDDIKAYLECKVTLEDGIRSGTIKLPNTFLEEGINTQQAMNYNYNSWQDFFNVRQLLALAWLHEAILGIPSQAERDALLILFSGVLEFNNLFASYKGEGTGAVRHMFSHHILKPERRPIEANVWGTPKSSGSFSGLYKSKLLRALDYRQYPFEVGLNGAKKIYGSSLPMAQENLMPWGSFEAGKISLSCGDSSSTHLPDASVNLIVTDPPFFDNVNYSELADFFYAWQVLSPRGFIENGNSTRSSMEVQDSNLQRFSNKLRDVFFECKRLLKDDGLLIFSYHYSRVDGWAALSQSVYEAGFYVAQSYPVYAELSASTPKSRAKNPIFVDAILVCKKKEVNELPVLDVQKALEKAIETTAFQLNRLAAVAFELTDGDKFVVWMSQFFVALGDGFTGDAIRKILKENEVALGRQFREINIDLSSRSLRDTHAPLKHVQLSMF